jgi:hypothetical protein
MTEQRGNNKEKIKFTVPLSLLKCMSIIMATVDRQRSAMSDAYKNLNRVARDIPDDVARPREVHQSLILTPSS